MYVPNGRTLDSPEYPRKLAFLDAIRNPELAAEFPLIVSGDMNIAPADTDVYDPAAFAGGTHVSAPSARLAAILDGGMVDSYRPMHPTRSSTPGGTTAPATSTRASACGSTWRWSASHRRRA